MKRKNAMSAMGYAICSVIVLAIIMIISAPMLVNKSEKKDNSRVHKEVREEVYEERSDNYINIAEEIRRIESSLSSRIDQLESAASSDNSQTVSNKYICTIDKSPEGQLEPIDGETRKFIFVCEYKE